MKGIQIIILLTVALLYSCSFIRMNNKSNDIDEDLKKLFEEEIMKNNPDSKNISKFFEKLENYLKEGSNLVLADKFDEIELEVEQKSVKLLSNDDIEDLKFEDIEEKLADIYRPYYNNLLINYESLLKVDEESDLLKLEEKLDNVVQLGNEIEVFANTDSDIKKEFESILAECEEHVLKVLSKALDDSSKEKLEKKVDIHKLYLHAKQAVSDLRRLLRDVRRQKWY